MAFFWQAATAPIGGMSGGPLVDLDGRVLGLNIARAGRVETWALPGDVIQPIMADLKAGKYSPINK